MSRARIASFRIIHESVGNDAAASFQRAGYQGCRISPPDLAMALMAVVHAAHPKRFAQCRSEERPNRSWNQYSAATMVPRHLFESDASQALFFSQSNIDQRIVNLTAQACLLRWSR